MSEGVKARRKREVIIDPSDLPTRSHTIREFCVLEQISESAYFKLAASGRGPKVMRHGKSVRITPEARAEWRRQREQAHG